MCRNYGRSYLRFILYLLVILVICHSAAAVRVCKGTKEEDPGCWEQSKLLTVVLVPIFCFFAIVMPFVWVCWLKDKVRTLRERCHTCDDYEETNEC
jgi:hypothetical protein